MVTINLPDDVSAFYFLFSNTLGRYTATAYKFRSEASYHRQGADPQTVIDEILADLKEGRSIRERNAEAARARPVEYSKPVDISSINLNEIELDL